VEIFQVFICVLLVTVLSMDASENNTDWLDLMLARLVINPLSGSLLEQADQYRTSVIINKNDACEIKQEKEKMRRMFLVIGALQGWEKVSATLKLRTTYELLQVDTGRQIAKERLACELKNFEK